MSIMQPEIRNKKWSPEALKRKTEESVIQTLLIVIACKKITRHAVNVICTIQSHFPTWSALVLLEIREVWELKYLCLVGFECFLSLDSVVMANEIIGDLEIPESLSSNKENPNPKNTHSTEEDELEMRLVEECDKDVNH